MDYEKEYKASYKRAKEEYAATDDPETKKKLANVFPELAETREEKIKKAIIKTLDEKIRFGLAKLDEDVCLNEAKDWVSKIKTDEKHDYIYDERIEVIATLLFNMSMRYDSYPELKELINKGRPEDKRLTFHSLWECVNDLCINWTADDDRKAEEAAAMIKSRGDWIRSSDVTDEIANWLTELPKRIKREK